MCSSEGYFFFATSRLSRISMATSANTAWSKLYYSPYRLGPRGTLSWLDRLLLRVLNFRPKTTAISTCGHCRMLTDVYVLSQYTCRYTLYIQLIVSGLVGIFGIYTNRSPCLRPVGIGDMCQPTGDLGVSPRAVAKVTNVHNVHV